MPMATSGKIASHVMTARTCTEGGAGTEAGAAVAAGMVAAADVALAAGVDRVVVSVVTSAPRMIPTEWL